MSSAEGGTAQYTYSNGANQDCWTAWTFPGIGSGLYDIDVRIPNALNTPAPVAPAAIHYNVYTNGGVSAAWNRVTSAAVDQNYDQGTWKRIGTTVAINYTGGDPVRVTMSDAWFNYLQYVLLIDAVRFCPQ